jgi:hypothetical protein
MKDGSVAKPLNMWKKQNSSKPTTDKRFPRTELELLAFKAFKCARKLLSLVTNLLRATTFVVHVIRSSRTDGSAAKQQLGSNGVTGYVWHFSNAFSSFRVVFDSLTISLDDLPHLMHFLLGKSKVSEFREDFQVIGFLGR